MFLRSGVNRPETVRLGFAGQAPLLPFLDSFAHRIGETPNRTYVISLGPVEPAQT